MNPRDVERDERTVAVENAGYRWSYLVLSFGLLGLSAYRSLVRSEAPWDLLALVVIGGIVNGLYQARGRVLYRRWVLLTLFTFVLAGLLAVGIIAVRSAR